MAPGPEVSHGIVWSGFQEMWSVGPSIFMNLKLKCTWGQLVIFVLLKPSGLRFSYILVMVDKPEALFLNEFDADQNLIY